MQKPDGKLKLEGFGFGLFQNEIRAFSTFLTAGKGASFCYHSVFCTP
jgi:hypothetical protein